MTHQLAILSCYYNFNHNRWLEANVRHCVKKWRKAGAYVIFVELALDDTQFVFHDSIDQGEDDERNLFHILLRYHVRDVLWFKEMALQHALKYVPQDIPYVGWFDNDVYFAMPETDKELTDQWWVDAISNTFQQNTSLTLLQPFADIVLTTETIRNGLMSVQTSELQEKSENTINRIEGEDTGNNKNGTLQVSTTIEKTLTEYEAINKCKRMRRIGKCIMTDPQNGDTGSAWVARRECIAHVGFYTHTYFGCGEDVMFNILQGSQSENTLTVIHHDIQRYYFQEKSVFAKNIQKYRRRWMSHSGIPVKCAYLPCTLMHMYHGELASKQTKYERHNMFKSKHFNLYRHMVSNPECKDFLQWTDAFRETGINDEFKASLERNQTVRDKVLLRMAKTQKCLTEMKKHVHSVHRCKEQIKQQEEHSNDHLQSLLQNCLQTLHSIKMDL